MKDLERDEQLFNAVQELNHLVAKVDDMLVWTDTGIALTEDEIETYLKYNVVLNG